MLATLLHFGATRIMVLAHSYSPSSALRSHEASSLDGRWLIYIGMVWLCKLYHLYRLVDRPRSTRRALQAQPLEPHVRGIMCMWHRQGRSMGGGHGTSSFSESVVGIWNGNRFKTYKVLVGRCRASSASPKAPRPRVRISLYSSLMLL